MILVGNISGTFNNSASIDVISLSSNEDVIYIAESDNITKLLMEDKIGKTLAQAYLTMLLLILQSTPMITAKYG